MLWHKTNLLCAITTGKQDILYVIGVNCAIVIFSSVIANNFENSSDSLLTLKLLEDLQYFWHNHKGVTGTVRLTAKMAVNLYHQD